MRLRVVCIALPQQRRFAMLTVIRLDCAAPCGSARTALATVAVGCVCLLFAVLNHSEQEVLKQLHDAHHRLKNEIQQLQVPFTSL